jgi:hypothetical protein
MEDTFEVKGEVYTYKLRKPKIGDWKEYYKQRKKLIEEYGSERDADNFVSSVFLLERCLVEPKMPVDEIPLADFAILTSELMKSSIPPPLRGKTTPSTLM